jgi:endonuclease G
LESILSKLLILIFAAILSSAAVADVCDDMTPHGKPTVATGERATRLCRKMYVLEHSSTRHTAFWSAEHLLGSQQGVAVDRVNAFKADPDLPKAEAAKPSDYTNTGYDQGHMAPVGDMHADAAAMLESFYLSNMVPQIPGNNRDGWNHLEYFVRGASMSKQDVYVITGPVYECTVCKTIGKTKVAIPTHLYKIVYDKKSNTAISFLVPNIAFNESDIPRYISNIATIQGMTGIVFFPSNATPIVESTTMWALK